MAEAAALFFWLPKRSDFRGKVDTGGADGGQTPLVADGERVGPHHLRTGSVSGTTTCPVRSPVSSSTSATTAHMILPMLRRVFAIVSALSLVLCAAVCVLWVRSYSNETLLYRESRGGATFR